MKTMPVEVRTFEFASEILGNVRNVWVMQGSAMLKAERPAGFCVLLDAEYYLKMDLPELLPDFFEQVPVTMLLVSNINSDSRFREFACNSPFAECIVHELLPWAEEKFGRPANAKNLIGGLSLSGLAAAFIGFLYPENFRNVLCQSGSFWWSDEWLTDTYATSTRKDLNFYLSCGVNERNTNLNHREGFFQKKSQVDVNRSFYKVLQGKGYPAVYSEREGTHSLESWKRDLPLGFRRLYP